MAASVNFPYGLYGKDSKIREHLDAIQTLVAGLDAGTTDFSTLTIAGALTNTGKLITDTAGNVLKPNHPAFVASMSGNQTITGATAPSILLTIQFNTEVTDIGGDFNPSTYTFTAPVGGVYMFGLGLTLDSGTASSSATGLVAVAGSTIFSTTFTHTDVANETTREIVSFIDLDANDTVTANARMNHALGQSSSFRIVGGTSFKKNYFYGTLLG
jgi:hypothetical protein